MSNTIAPKSKRVPYGFKLNFPAEFTMRELRKLKSHKVKYITLYMRVQKALKAGTVVPVGEKVPDHAKRGRRELVFRTVASAPTT